MKLHHRSLSPAVHASQSEPKLKKLSPPRHDSPLRLDRAPQAWHAPTRVSPPLFDKAWMVQSPARGSQPRSQSATPKRASHATMGSPPRRPASAVSPSPAKASPQPRTSSREANMYSREANMLQQRGKADHPSRSVPSVASPAWLVRGVKSGPPYAVNRSKGRDGVNRSKGRDAVNRSTGRDGVNRSTGRDADVGGGGETWDDGRAPPHSVV